MVEVSRRALIVAGSILCALAPPVLARELREEAPSPLTQPADPIAYHDTAARAARLLAANDFAAAEPLFEQLVRNYPLDRANWTGLATTKRRLGKCGEAIPAYERSLDLIGPFSGQARYWIAACQLQLGHKEAALQTLHAHVFDDVDVSRARLIDEPEFAALKDDPRMQQIAGRSP